MNQGEQVRFGWLERLSTLSEETEAKLTKKALSDLSSETQSLDETLNNIDFQQLLVEYKEFVERIMMILSGKTEYDAVLVEAYMNRYQDIKQIIGTIIDMKNNEESSVVEFLRLDDKIDQSVYKYKSMESDGSLQLLISPSRKNTPRRPKREKKTKSKKSKKTSSSTVVVIDPQLSIQNLSVSKHTPRKEKISHSELYSTEITENIGPFECPICIEEISVGVGYKISSCNHTYCQQCLSSYLQQLINQGLVLDIHCPHPSCETILSYTEIKRLCDSKTFAKYEEFTFSAYLKSDPNVRWCPNPKGCGNAIVNDCPFEKKMHCHQCTFQFCFECNEEWHTGTCEDLQRWKIENGKVDKEFIKFVKSANTKKCPKCKVQIQKANGCNHMTCGNCHFQFCWLCNARYTPSHFRLYNPLGCPMMQWKGEDSGKFSTGKRIGLKALVGTGYIVGAAIAIPLIIPATIIGVPIYGGYKLIKKKNRPHPVLS